MMSHARSFAVDSRGTDARKQIPRVAEVLASDVDERIKNSEA